VVHGVARGVDLTLFPLPPPLLPLLLPFPFPVGGADVGGGIGALLVIGGPLTVGPLTGGFDGSSLGLALGISLGKGEGASVCNMRMGEPVGDGVSVQMSSGPKIMKHVSI